MFAMTILHPDYEGWQRWKTSMQQTTFDDEFFEMQMFSVAKTIVCYVDKEIQSCIFVYTCIVYFGTIGVSLW